MMFASTCEKLLNKILPFYPSFGQVLTIDVFIEQIHNHFTVLEIVHSNWKGLFDVNHHSVCVCVCVCVCVHVYVCK